MKSAVITGATSFIGNHLVRNLLAKGVECYAIVRPESRNLSALPIKNPGLHLIRGNASMPEEWAEEIPDGDAFFHFAWDGVGAEGRANPVIQERNVNMSVNCLRAASALGCRRFIFAGSQAEYGINDDFITEDTECHPKIEYGKGKLEFLRRAVPLSQELGIEYVHLRIFSVYGPGDHPWTLVSRCLDAFLRDEAVELSSCEQKWNFLYAEDAAEAVSCFGDCWLDSGPVYNIAGTETKQLREYVETMRRLCGGGDPQYGILGQGMEPPHGIDPSVQKMQKAIGWTMKTDFEAGIRKMLELRGVAG